MKKMLTFVCMCVLLQVGSVFASAELPAKYEQLSAIFQEWNELLESRPTEEEVKLFEGDLLLRINRLKLPMNLGSIGRTNLLLAHYRLTKDSYLATLEEMRKPLQALFGEWNAFLDTRPSRHTLLEFFSQISARMHNAESREHRDIEQTKKLLLSHLKLTRDAYLKELFELERREPWRMLGFETLEGMRAYVANQAKKTRLFVARKDHTVQGGLEIHVSSGPNFAHAGDQNGRLRMEDDHTEVRLGEGRLVYAVFDGHRLSHAANLAAGRLPFYFQVLMQHRASPSLALELSFVLIEEDLAGSDQHVSTAGTTAIVAFLDLSARKLYFANLGDSRGVLFDSSGHVLIETKDHTPQVEAERLALIGARIIEEEGARQGWFSYHGMTFPMTRALGDFHIRSQDGRHDLKEVLISKPDVYGGSLPKGGFLILACDGLWDVMTSEQVGVFVRERLEGTALPDIAQQLVAKAKTLPRLADGKENIDNISVTLVRLNEIE